MDTQSIGYLMDSLRPVPVARSSEPVLGCSLPPRPPLLPSPGGGRHHETVMAHVLQCVCACVRASIRECVSTSICICVSVCLSVCPSVRSHAVYSLSLALGFSCPPFLARLRGRERGRARRSERQTDRQTDRDRERRDRKRREETDRERVFCSCICVFSSFVRSLYRSACLSACFELTLSLCGRALPLSAEAARKVAFRLLSSSPPSFMLSECICACVCVRVCLNICVPCACLLVFCCLAANFMRAPCMGTRVRACACFCVRLCVHMPVCL